MDQHRINSMLGEGINDFKGRGFLIADVREAARSVSRTHKELRLYIESERRLGGRFRPKEPKLKLADGDERIINNDDEEPKRSTSFRHFVGITEIQANLLIGILNTSRAIQQESLEIWRRLIGSRFGSSILPSGSVGISSALTGTGRIEINNIFNGAVNLTDRERVTEVAEELANETIAQLRAVGLRV